MAHDGPRWRSRSWPRHRRASARHRRLHLIRLGVETSRPLAALRPRAVTSIQRRHLQELDLRSSLPAAIPRDHPGKDEGSFVPRSNGSCLSALMDAGLFEVTLSDLAARRRGMTGKALCARVRQDVLGRPLRWPRVLPRRMHQGNLKIAPKAISWRWIFSAIGRPTPHPPGLGRILMGFIARITAASRRCISRPAYGAPGPRHRRVRPSPAIRGRTDLRDGCQPISMAHFWPICSR